MSDLDWGALRSACHRKAWREAWGIIGVDHTGDATPGEVYIFGVARQARAVAAALASWRDVFLGPRLVPVRRGFDPKYPVHNGHYYTIHARVYKALKKEAHALDRHELHWQRIKQIAAWESQAAAQHAEHSLALRKRFAEAVRSELGGER